MPDLNDEAATRPARRFSMLSGSYAVARMEPTDPVPAWALGAGGFVSITRTAAELSIVCQESEVPAGCRAERGWVVLQLEGPFAFTETGVLASFAVPLAEAGVSIFTVSTFDTDYILVQDSARARALTALVAAGHTLVS